MSIKYLFCQLTYWLELTHFKRGEAVVQGLNPDPYVYYALSLPTENDQIDLLIHFSNLDPYVYYAPTQMDQNRRIKDLIV